MLVIKEKLAYHIKIVFSLEGKKSKAPTLPTIHFSLRGEIGVRLPAKIVCHDINDLFLLARLFLQKPFLRQGCARLHW
jgi:hypothetical protein